MEAVRRLNARRLVGAALLALLLTQWVALVHAVAHAPRAQAGAVSHEHAPAFGHAASSPACQLIDHVLVGQSGGAAVTIDEPVLVGSEQALPVQQRIAARTVQLPPARGPPPA